MSGQLWLVILALAAGVLIPKAVGPLLAPPSGGGGREGAWQRLLDALPPVILGSLTAITATSSNPRHVSGWTVAVVGAVVVLAVVMTRRKRSKTHEKH